MRPRKILQALEAIPGLPRSHFHGGRDPRPDIRHIVARARGVLPSDDKAMARETTEPKNIENLFKKAREGLSGAAAKHMGNRISRARRAFKVLGIDLNDGWGCSLSSEWDALFARLPRASRARNRFFAATCTTWKVSPQQVTTEVMTQFASHYCETRDQKSARQTIVDFFDAWIDDAVPLLGRRAPIPVSPFRPRDNFLIEDGWPTALLEDVKRAAQDIWNRRRARRGAV